MRARRSLLAFGLLSLLVLSASAAPRVPWTTSRVTGSPNPPAPYRVVPAFPGLKFDRPVDAGVMPGTDRIFVLEQGGKLYSFPNKSDVTQKDQVFDFRPRHQPFDSSYSFAFHPHFIENHYIYVCYAEPGGRPDGTFVSRFTVQPTTPPTIDPASEVVLIRWLSGGHNGSALAFGNDGYLYISAGDGADPDPPDSKAKTGQDISDLLADILRIDVDHTDGAKNYTIPPSNPFIKTPGARPEVYAFGLRNPWRMSFDRPTGDLWVGDVGWEQWEMIHRVKAGGNYGWSIVEGPNTHVRTDVTPGPGPIIPPMISLPHSEAASITGGLVYHGNKLTKLRGAYVYGDWETGKFWGLRHDGDKLVSNDELCATSLKPVAFAADYEDELLIVDYNGGLYSLAPNIAPPANLAFPRHLSETGIYQDMATLAPAPGVVPYRVNASMWNDSATAERVLGVPGDGAISTANGRQIISGKMWYFPTNTVFSRTLMLELEKGNAASRRRVETQLFHFDGQAWNAYTFRWNAVQTDADLVPKEGTNEVFTVKDAAAPGGQREVPWRFVSRAECFRCHNAWAGETLSFNWLELNTPGSKSELQRLAELGVLQMKNAPTPLPALVNPYDASAPLGERARSWLQVNCGTCHRFGAGGGIPSQFNYERPLDQLRVLNAKPARGDFGIAGARVIAPGDPYRSTMFYRINTEGAGRMPHIGSRIADEAGIAVLREWIRTLPPVADMEPDAAAAARLATENAALLGRCRKDASAEAVKQLLANTGGALALLSAVDEQGPLSPLRQAVTAAAANESNAVIRDLLQRLLPPGQRRHTLGTEIDPQMILRLGGDAARGRKLFHDEGGAQCARCHKLEGQGREFGPDLANITRKYSRAQVLEQILYPSKIIAPEFKTYSVTLKDDTEWTGFIVKRSATEIVLKDENLAEHHVALTDLKTTRESALSAMPEGLLAPMTAQEAADLLEYLVQSKGK